MHPGRRLLLAWDCGGGRDSCRERAAAVTEVSAAPEPALLLGCASAKGEHGCCSGARLTLWAWLLPGEHLIRSCRRQLSSRSPHCPRKLPSECPAAIGAAKCAHDGRRRVTTVPTGPLGSAVWRRAHKSKQAGTCWKSGAVLRSIGSTTGRRRTCQRAARTPLLHVFCQLFTQFPP